MNYLDAYIGRGTSTDLFLHKVGDVIKPLPNAAPMVVKGRDHGGFGAVYFVQSNDTGWMSALKAPRFDLYQNSETLDSFTREAMTWVNLPSNALILPAYRVVRYSGVPYVHMEFVPPVTGSGASIGAVMRDGKGALGAQALSIVAGQLLYLLAELEAWDSSFTHGDIKPDNILLHLSGESTLNAASSNDLEIRLSDFGLSRYRNDLGAHGSTAGDLRYLAPEVLVRYGWMETPEPAGRDSKSARRDEQKAQDIYAVGCTIFEMVYGSQWHVVRPVQHSVSTLEDSGITPKALASARPDIKPPMIELILRCLDRSAQNRPNTFADLQALWKAAVAEGGGTTGNFTIRGTQVDSRVYPEAEGVPLYHYLVGVGRSAGFSAQICQQLLDASNLRAAGRFKDSDGLLDGIEQEQPGFPPVLAARAHGLALQGAGNASVGLYLKAVAGYQEDDKLKNMDELGFAAACSTSALLLSQMARRDLADQAVELALLGAKARPDETKCINALGVALLLAHKVEQSLTWLRQAHQIDPGNRQLRTALAAGLFAARAHNSSEFESLNLTSTEKAQGLELAKSLGYGSVA
jgi:tetratricopeptide (TPR) repeat protein